MHPKKRRPKKETVKSKLKRAAGLKNPGHLKLKAKLDKAKKARKKALDQA